MKPQPCLQDMPLLVKRTIADHLESYLDKLSFQKLNKHFQQVIELNVKDAGLSISVDGDEVFVAFNWCKRTYKTRYSREGSGSDCHGKMYNLSQSAKQTKKKLFVNRGAVDMAITDFKMFLNNPGITDLTLDLQLDGRDEGASDAIRQAVFDDVSAILRKIAQKPKVKRLNLSCNYGSEETILQVLPYLSPETLDTLYLWFNYGSEINFEKIKHLEQIRGLRELQTSNITNLSFDALPNCIRGSITLDLVDTGLKDLRKFVKHFRSCPSFESFEISTYYADKRLTKALCKPNAFIRGDNAYIAKLYKTPTKNFLYISIRNGNIEIQGKQRIGHDPSLYEVETDDKEEDEFYEVEDDMDYQYRESDDDLEEFWDDSD